MKIFENNQEVFDAVYKHIANQRVACVNDQGVAWPKLATFYRN